MILVPTKMPESCKKCWFEYAGEFCNAIREACPLVEMPEDMRPERHGHWVQLDDCMMICSECYALGCGTPYCATCGAKMEGGDNV